MRNAWSQSVCSVLALGRGKALLLETHVITNIAAYANQNKTLSICARVASCAVIEN